MKKISKQFNHIYEELSPEAIPWNSMELPACVSDLIESGVIRPCRAIDIGCGLGNYSRILSNMGFDMTGIDFSEVAIKKARNLSQEEGISIQFHIADLCKDLELEIPPFDFAIEYELLHHIFPENRDLYAQNIAKLLKTGALYLSVAFSEEDKCFGGKGKYRKTPLGTELYFSNKDEIEKLFSPLFTILDLKIVDLPGKFGNHKAVFALMRKDHA